jgi:hypothetical protein
MSKAKLPGIHVPKEALDSLRAICNNITEIEKIVCPPDSETSGRKSEDLRLFLQGKISSIKVPGNVNLLDHLMGLESLRDNSDISADELFSKMTESLNAFGAEWNDRDRATWKNCETPFRGIFGPDSLLYIITKSVKLTAEHQNNLSSANIITDVRPIFDNGGDNILRSIIYHTLVIEFSKGDSVYKRGIRAKLHICLSDEDIDEIVEACKRAKKKRESIRALLKSLIPTQDSGSVTDG